ncbi:MAG: hypothetical protein QM813_26415 [Verrucomicrobiota bacterium]
MSAFKTDGDFTTASPTGVARVSFPIDGDTSARIIEQDYIQLASSFAALALNTPHPTIATAFLVGESPLEDLGAGVVQWTRRFATVPANRDEFESFSYRFPGLLGASNPPYNQYWVTEPGDGRDPRVDTVSSRLAHEYFLVGAGQTYTTPSEIPVIESQQYTLVGNDNVSINYLLAAGVYPDDSTPTKEDYLTMIASEDELVAEDSRISRWLGNIFVRITRYVKAK